MKVLARHSQPYYLVPFLALALFFHNASCAFAQDLTISGTPQETNDRIKSMAQTSKPTSHEYTIGSGDLLVISVFDVPELTREVRVNQSGTIAIPLIPSRLHIAGLTEVQAEQKIADVLEANGLVSHPEVSVTVKEHRSRPITVVGAVSHPMVYEADRGVTLLEVLAEAGGVANDAGDTIIVTRPRSAIFIPIPNPQPIPESAPGAAETPNTPEAATQPSPEDKDKPSETPDTSTSTAFPSAQVAQAPSGAADNENKTPGSSAPGNIISINLNELLENGDMRNNIPLQAGDVVTVPHAGIVYVLGAVNRPGGFVLSNDRTQLTTLKILALAGGQTKTAKLDHAVIVRKDSQGKQTETDVDLKKVIHRESEDLQMRASDILYIPESTAKQVMYQSIQLAIALGSSVAIYRLAYH